MAKVVATQSKKPAPLTKTKAVSAAPARLTVKAQESISEMKASARFIHIAPRKVRLVIDLVRGANIDDALNTLRYTNKAAAEPVLKLVKSAIANASHNFSVESKYLFIKKITANDGPIIKRYRPRAHGSSAPIRKRMSHIEITLGVKPGATIKQKKEDKKEDVTMVAPDEVKKDSSRPVDTNNDKTGKEKKGFVKGMFQRKTG